jgi:hypothetical protein
MRPVEHYFHKGALLLGTSSGGKTRCRTVFKENKERKVEFGKGRRFLSALSSIAASGIAASSPQPTHSFPTSSNRANPSTNLFLDI